MKTIKKQLKRAFTIVELVIVIAVIAVLAAVLIPTFVNVLDSANQSNDTVLAKNLDTSLITVQSKLNKTDVTDGDGNYIYNVTEAITWVRNDGYDVSKLTPTADKADYVYNASTNRILYYTDDFTTLAYGEEPDTTDTLVIIDSDLERVSAAASSTLFDGITVNYCVYSTDDTVSVTNTTGITVWVYSVSGSTVTINLTDGTAYHYGEAGLVEVVKVASNSYHLYGSATEINLTEGHVVLESNSQTGTLNINSTTNTKLTYSDDAEIEEFYAVSGFDEIYNENSSTKVDADTLSSSLGIEVGSMLTNDNAATALATSGSYKVTENITLSSSVTISSGESVVLDLNGYTITVSTSSSDGIIVNGSFTINDSSSDESGVWNYTGSSNAIVVESGSFTLNAGTIKNDKYYGIYCKDGGSAVINGGTISSKESALAGNNKTGDMSFTVNGGILTAAQGPAIYMPGQFSLIITGGTLNGGISLRMGNVTISGGTINAITDTEKIDSIEDYYNYSGNAWLADALYVFGGTYTSDNANGNSLNLIITGGTFNCTNGQGSAVAIYDLGKVEQTMNVTISGGEFNTNTKSDTRSAYQVLSLSDIGVSVSDDSESFVSKTDYTDPKYYDKSEYTGKVSTTITGGTFSSSPAAYLGEDYDVTIDANSKYVVSKKNS